MRLLSVSLSCAGRKRSPLSSHFTHALGLGLSLFTTLLCCDREGRGVCGLDQLPQLLPCRGKRERRPSDRNCRRAFHGIPWAVLCCTDRRRAAAAVEVPRRSSFAFISCYSGLVAALLP
ncbi:hypothetical protein DAI22_07g275400 [Oryza sativa Japonica Group]|nr:hypothetical protein DAI22_07g275400 [Oryza sativa Japonica Group]